MQSAIEPDGFKFISEKEKLSQIYVNGILDVSKDLSVYARLVFKKKDIKFYIKLKEILKENNDYLAGDLLAQVYEKYIEYVDSKWNEKIKLEQGYFCFVGENKIFSDMEYASLVSNEDARHPWQRWVEYLDRLKKKKKYTREELISKIQKLKATEEYLERQLEEEKTRIEKAKETVEYQRGRLEYASNFLKKVKSGEWVASKEDCSKAKKEHDILCQYDCDEILGDLKLDAIEKRKRIKRQQRRVRRKLEKTKSELSLLYGGDEED
jgi:hypothetical protein